jgi:uncharacterized phage-associated protein
MSTVDVRDVAKYFLSLCDEEVGDTISNLKLQKLVYYAQGFHLALTGKPLFDDEIEAWAHGPVVPSLYHEYKDHKACAIKSPDDFDPSCIPSDVRALLDEVYTVYGQFSAWKLRNLTHEEKPWIDAYDKTVIIPKKAMKEYFSNLIEHED